MADENVKLQVKGKRFIFTGTKKNNLERRRTGTVR